MDDSKIVELYFARDMRAIEETSLKYNAYCRAIAVNILKSREDAEECVNDALDRAWNTIPPKKPGNLGTYIGKIVRSISVDRCRHNSAEKRGGGRVNEIFDELSECISDKNNVENTLETKELTEYINSFLKTLPESKRSIFVLRYWYAMEIGEIALRTGKGKSSVSVILYRLRNELKEYLSERGYFI